MTHQPIQDNAGEYRWPLPTVKHPDPSIADRPAYIALCRACRGMIGCCGTDGILVHVADFVAECIKHGATIHYVTAADVWAYAGRTRELLAANYRIIAANVEWKRRRPDSEKE